MISVMVTRLDESLGRIVASLGDKGLLKNSIIILMTDNGAPTIGKYRNSGSNWPLRGVSNLQLKLTQAKIINKLSVLIIIN